MKPRSKRPFDFTDVEDLLVAEHRRQRPASRAPRLVVYARNGTSVARKKCIYCGSIGPSWCAKWPKTNRATQWETEHVAKHEYDVARNLVCFLRRKACSGKRPASPLVPLGLGTLASCNG